LIASPAGPNTIHSARFFFDQADAWFLVALVRFHTIL